jgi:RNA polymerase sporulation-specific sigma factor
MNQKEKIIKDYEKIINGILKKMNLKYHRDELFDIGMIGFVKGLNTYNDNKGTKISTYLYKCVKNEIMKQLKYENCVSRTADVVSLNVLVGKDEETELGDLIGYKEEYEKNLYKSELYRIIDCRISFMSEKQRDILYHFYGLEGCKKMSIDELAQKYNTTKQNINGIKRRLINQLKYITRDFYQNYKEGLYDKEDRQIQSHYYS